MRHGDKINNLGRTDSHRRAMLANMTISLIEHKRITTTLAKAKALRRYAEPLLTKAKDNTTHSRRVVFSYLQNKEAINELFGPVAEKIGDRAGGYLRIIKMGFRRGDGADMAMIELVDFNEVYNAKGASSKDNKKKTRRGRRTSGATPVVAAAAAVATPAVVEEVAVVAEEAAPAVEEIVEEVAAPEVVEVVEEVVAEAPAAEEAPATEEAPAADDTKEEENA
jgi:large subunit ribosomal protein L17